MARLLLALFIVLHGLAHFWYVALSQKIVGFRPEMGWNGRSWIFTNALGDPITRLFAGILFALAATGLVAGGIGIFARSPWAQPLLVGSAAVSAAAIILFWDGSLARMVEKGLVGFLVSLVILGGATVSARYNRELRAARERVAGMGGQMIETDCGPIEYAREGQGYPVLAIHGNGGGFDQGLNLARTYIGAGYDVIAPSRFGYLGSPMPQEPSVALQADAYTCLLDALKLDRVAIFASSAGVTSAVQFALQHPERVSALIFHSPNAPGEVGLTPPPKSLFSAMMHSDFTLWALTTYFRPVMQSFVGVPKGFTLTPELEEDVRAILYGVLPVSERGDGMVFDTFTGNPEINHYPLGEVTAPTLVVSAVDDPMALHSGARTLAERIPGARLSAVPDGGHLLLGHSAEVQAEVRQFLASYVAVEATSR